MFKSEENNLLEKWSDVLDHDKMPAITNPYKREVTAVILENIHNEINRNKNTYRTLMNEAGIPVNAMGASSSDPSTGALDIYDPILISMARRTMPNLIALDLVGTQPLTGPTGVVFTLRTRYSNQTGAENFYDEVDTSFSTVVTGANTLGQKHVGTVPGVSNNAANGSYNYATGMATAQAEALGSTSNVAWPEMSFSIDRYTVTAESRKLKAQYTQEVMQDLKHVHGLEVDSLLSELLCAEIVAEQNRELIRTVVVAAKPGGQNYTATPGVLNLDTDSNGRWSQERFVSILFHIEVEANRIARETRRGKGNIVLCSSDVASALAMTGKLDYAPAMKANAGLEVDDTGNTFVGVLMGRYRVYIDPYTTGNYLVVGYKGPSPLDAGIIFSPYTPLIRAQAVEPGTLTPVIGYATRYAVSSSPFAGGAAVQAGVVGVDNNVFYRRLILQNIM